MKIIQINCVYNSGSTGKIVYDMHKFLENEGHDSIVIYGRMAQTQDKNVYKLCGEFYSKVNHALSKITGIMHGGCFFSTNRIIKFIKRENPDIVHLHCINGYFVNIYRLVTFLKKSGIKTVVTLHAEFMYTGGCGHAVTCEKWKKSQGCKKCPRLKSEIDTLFLDRTATMWKRMKRAFEGFNNDNLIVTSVSPWLKERAELSQILGDKRHKVVLDGVDTEIFNISEHKAEPKFVFHVTPYFTDDENHLKGGRYIIRLAEMLPEVKFLIAGSSKPNMKLPENIELLGKKTSEELARLYSAASLTVIASSRETFSMVTAESLCCGTPVVGFKAGAPEQIALPEYSAFCNYGDINELKKAVEEMLSCKLDETKISSKALKEYSNKKMTKDYLGIYRELLGVNND